MSRNSSSKKLKTSSSLKRYQTSGSVRESSKGNLTSRLQNADRTVLPSQVKQNSFFGKTLKVSGQTSAESSLNMEGTSDLSKLIRYLQPQSTKNARPPLTERGGVKPLGLVRASSVKQLNISFKDK